jgi:hypothetical protein
MRITLACAVALLTAAPLAAQTPSRTVPSAVTQLALGHRLTMWFQAGHMDSIVQRMAPEVVERSGGAEGLARARAELAERAGREATLLEEKMTRRRGLAQYWRSAMYDGSPEPIVMRWLFDEESRLVGFGLGPLSQTPEPDPQ